MLRTQKVAAMGRSDLYVKLADGTVIGYAEAGDPDGPPVLLLHGTPGSRLWVTHPVIRNAARDLGIRLIGVDRPGFGVSTFRRLPVVQYPQLVRGFAEELELKRFAVLGISSGGKYACACGWRLSGLVTGVVLVSSLCPPDLPGANATWSRPDRLWRIVARRAPWLLRVIYAKIGHERRAGRPSALMLSVLTRSDPDKAVVEWERKEFPQESLRQDAEAFRQGGRAAAREDTLNAQPWGVPLAKIAIPVEIWHGADDRLVLPQQARILSEALPHATTHLVPGQGHLLAFTSHMHDILRSALSH